MIHQARRLAQQLAAGSELSNRHGYLHMLITRLAFLARAMGSNTSTAASSSYSTMSSQIKQLVDSTIDGNFIAVFSKSYCPYCSRAKSLINSLELSEGKQVKIYECVFCPPPRIMANGHLTTAQIGPNESARVSLH